LQIKKIIKYIQKDIKRIQLFANITSSKKTRTQIVILKEEENEKKN